MTSYPAHAPREEDLTDPFQYTKTKSEEDSSTKHNKQETLLNDFTVNLTPDISNIKDAVSPIPPEPAQR